MYLLINKVNKICCSFSYVSGNSEKEEIGDGLLQLLLFIVDKFIYLSVSCITKTKKK